MSQRHVRADTLQELQDQFGDSVLALELDVTNRKECFDAIQKAKDHFKKLDVVINNAGYGQFGAIEELSEEEARQQMETNFFGALWVTQAALPVMREQKSGRILTSIKHWGYCGFSKHWYVSCIQMGTGRIFRIRLSKEVAGFGIHVTLIEPGGFDSTDWSRQFSKTCESQFRHMIKLEKKELRCEAGMKQGDPNATAEAILKVVDADQPPLRIFLGEHAYTDWRKQQYAKKRLENWEQWQPVSLEAQGAN